MEENLRRAMLLSRGDRVTVYPSPSDVLRTGDLLVMSGAIGDMERFFSSVHPKT